MRSRVVYESMFGNTAAIADGLPIHGSALTDQERALLELLGGMDDLRTANPGGTGIPWLQLAATVLLVFACLAVIQRHIRRDPDRDR